MPNMLTLALSKGRIFEETLPLLKAAGIEPLDDPETSRKLILATNQPDVRLIIVRASDVPSYVEYGGADLGVAGKIIEISHQEVIEAVARVTPKLITLIKELVKEI